MSEPKDTNEAACGGSDLTAELGAVPAWWHYRVNRNWDGFSKELPPDDAYDEGTLIPLYTQDAIMAQRGKKTMETPFDAVPDDLDFLERILENECRWNPLIREVGGIAGNVNINFVTSIETLHAWLDGIKHLRAMYPDYGLVDVIEAQEEEIKRLTAMVSNAELRGRPLADGPA